MLDGYNLAKKDFVARESLAGSSSSAKREFYEIQIETNRKVEQAQIDDL